MEAAREKLVPVVYAGLLRLVHQDELLPQAEPTALCACPVGGAAVEDPPLDLRFEPLVLEGPDVAGQPRVYPLVGVLEGGFVVFFTPPLAPLEAEICPIEVLYGIAIVLQVGAVEQVAAFIILFIVTN